ncbi:MAG: tRNA lysidine(34) synthetase TilS [Flammeovirgaceae bacterium]|nr:tRNA lysidine(34) synthetase TilS [Flammeovirgaceae bacterium]
MLKRFIRHIEQKKLISPGKPALLAVSGGLDSMVMVDLFLESGFDIEIAHCNFQLRGQESDGDEEFIKNFCDKRNIVVHSKRMDTNNYATANGLSIQMAARALRYEWFDLLTIERHAEKIATAHHLNDSIETQILNFARTGLTGQGIHVQNEKIIRPLMIFTRKELEEYARSREVIWRQDSSNVTDDYQRNFVRHQIVPKLKEVNPSLEETVLRVTSRKELQRFVYNQKLSELRDQYFRYEKEGLSISKSLLTVYPEFTQPLLFELIRSYGFNSEQCDNIINSMNHTGAKFPVSDFELIVDRDVFLIVKKETSFIKSEIGQDEGEAILGGMRLTLKQIPKDKVSYQAGIEFLDLDALTFPLTWRSWQPGDSFQPLGMNQSKKLSDFLIDQKISIPDKQKITVVESGGIIAWVVGHRIDHRFRVKPSTLNVISLTLSD